MNAFSSETYRPDHYRAHPFRHFRSRRKTVQTAAKDDLEYNQKESVMMKSLDTGKFSVTLAPDAIRRTLQEHGLAVVEGLTSEFLATELASALGTIIPHRDSEVSGMTRIKFDSSRAGTAGLQGFSGQALFPHTDRSCLESPPHLILLVCAQQSEEGGVTTMVDGPELMEALKCDFPELLQEMCSPAAACFDDGEYRYKGPLFENARDGSTCVRLRNDRLAFFSAPLADKLKELYSVILAMTRRFELQAGQAYVVNNRRWLHGREAFKGDREMWRYLINWSPPSNGIGFANLR
jgi:alpha-ketoglutarate-dependent taurine dioxygenase